MLPLKSLRLYETGVGYFERTGVIGSQGGSSLPVPASHLDDALKSLVVLDAEGRAQLSGVRFASSTSKGMARARAGLPNDPDEPLSYRDLLASLKGAELEVRASSGSLRGRLIDVTVEGDDDEKGEKKRPPEIGLLLLSDRGEVVRVTAAQVSALRPVDAAVTERLAAALDALSARSAQGTRQIRLTSGSRRPLTLGYIAETPVWRATYRLVLPGAKAEGALQGWALVHNDTDEDWRGVSLQLVNGRPDSFLFPLAAPRYLRRGLVHPEDELSTVPQLFDTTPDAMWADGVGLGTVGTVGHGSGTGSGSGYGSGSGRVATITHGVGASSLLKVGDLSEAAPAVGAEVGALFVYRSNQPLELGAHSSALVPFLDRAVEAEAVTWVGDASSPPRSAVRFVNSTGQTLPAGTVAFFDGGGFAGESGLDRLKPGERRFIQYGADLDLEVKARPAAPSEEPKRLALAGEALEEHFLRETRVAYELENRAGRPRTVYAAQRLNQNASLKGADRVDFDAGASLPVAVFVVPRGKSQRAIVAVEGLSRKTPLDKLTADRLAQLAAAPSLQANERAAAGEAAARQRELEQARKAAEADRAEIAELEEDLDRLREHLKALGGEKGAGAGANPFVQRILAAEDRLAAARKRLDGHERDAKARGADVKR
ncbi:MAG TPA: DUF4139 domain-containing protein, partial [Polyangiaceae bacterium]|nr:DUF4139 domain-containing protein [Polyangiaceae bacterium]